MDFEWDDAKAESNERKHGVAFTEAMTVFADPLSRTIPNPLHSHDEDRFIIVGESAAGHTLVVVHTHRGEAVRIEPHLFYQGKEVGKMFYEGEEIGKASCSVDEEIGTTHYIDDSLPQARLRRNELVNPRHCQIPIFPAT